MDAARQAAGGLVRHAAWYVRYRMNGHTREAPGNSRDKRKQGGSAPPSEDR